jgi:hypothetical protein
MLMINYDVTNEIKVLREKFKNIKDKGYIKSINKFCSGAGYTLERELGLMNNDFQGPDFFGIEIKTKTDCSMDVIGLFSVKPTTENINFIEFVKKYGYKRETGKNWAGDIYSSLKYIGLFYKYKLVFFNNEKKMYIYIYNKYNRLVNSDLYWDYSAIWTTAIQKLNCLALVNVKTAKIENWFYYYYYNMQIYMLRDTNRIIELLKSGTIFLKVELQYRENEIGNKRLKYHGFVFSIKKNDLEELFNKIT